MYYMLPHTATPTFVRLPYIHDLSVSAPATMVACTPSSFKVPTCITPPSYVSTHFSVVIATTPSPQPRMQQTPHNPRCFLNNQSSHLLRHSGCSTTNSRYSSWETTSIQCLAPPSIAWVRSNHHHQQISSYNVFNTPST